MKRLLAMLLVAACAAAPPAPPPAPPGPFPEFAPRGEPRVVDPGVPASLGWRWLVSHLTTLRADAAARGEPRLVVFEADRLHATDGDGRRTTWLLPAGMALEPAGMRLLLPADGPPEPYGPEGEPVAPGAVFVTAAVEGAGGNVSKCRLEAKEGGGLRTIDSPG